MKLFEFFWFLILAVPSYFLVAKFFHRQQLLTTKDYILSYFFQLLFSVLSLSAIFLVMLSASTIFDNYCTGKTCEDHQLWSLIIQYIITIFSGCFLGYISQNRQNHLKNFGFIIMIVVIYAFVVAFSWMTLR
jgi:hypothetical protein